MTQPTPDYSVSNAVAIAVTTNRPEFLAAARASLKARGSMTVEDVEHLLNILGEVLEEDEKRKEAFRDAIHYLRQYEQTIASLPRKVEELYLAFCDTANDNGVRLDDYDRVLAKRVRERADFGSTGRA